MIIEVKAKFACDDCGTEFLVPLDPATVASEGESVFFLAEDSVRAGLNYEDGVDRDYQGIGSVSADGRHYCDRCTKLHDRSEQPS